MSFDDAWRAESSLYEPASGFRAVAEPEWLRTSAGPPPARAMHVGSWRLTPECVVRFGEEVDVLAAREDPPAVTWPLRADGCGHHAGYWQPAH